MGIIYWIVGILLIVISIQYIVGPILVFKSQIFPSKYKFNILDPEDFLAERSQTFLELHELIINNGFEYIGSSELIQSHSSMYFSIYNNFELKLACTLSTAHSQPTNSTQIEFTQMYSNGSVINVNNAPLFNIYPATNKKVCFRFPDTNDFETLLNMANRIIKSNKKHEERITFEKGQEISSIEGHLNTELGYLIEKGWVADKVENNERKLTLLGSILMTWQLCWPIKQILNAADVSASKKALNNA